MGKITASRVLKQALLPGILPRIKSLFFTGFHTLAFYIALVFRGVRLLPAVHPFLNADNIGQFGVMAVINAAYKNLTFKWTHIDQVLIFFTVLAGVLLTFLYVAAALAYIFVGPAMAATSISLWQMFSNADPSHDVAFMMMDRTFGIPGIYDSKVMTAPDVIMPTPFHKGMYALFAFYSTGMFFVASIILLYYMVEIVFESAVTGTPFGRHFDNILVPIRLVIAVGMLVPLSFGLNSLQWITLYVAKFGSNLASNAWAVYNDGLDNPMGLTNAELIATPTSSEPSGLIKDLFLLRSCVYLYEAAGAIEKPDNPPKAPGLFIVGPQGEVLDLLDAYTSDFGWLHAPPAGEFEIYKEAVKYSGGKNINVVVGVPDRNAYEKGTYPGGIIPVCGQVTTPVISTPSEDETDSDMNHFDIIGYSYLLNVAMILKPELDVYPGPSGAWGTQDVELSTYRMLIGTNLRGLYYQYKSEQSSAPAGTDKNLCYYDRQGSDGLDDFETSNGGYKTVDANVWGKCDEPLPPTFWQYLYNRYIPNFELPGLLGYEYLTGEAYHYLTKVQAQTKKTCDSITDSAASVVCKERLARVDELLFRFKRGLGASSPSQMYYDRMGHENPLAMTDEQHMDMLRYGWGGAGFWYKMVADRNGELIEATTTLPTVAKFPLLLEKIKDEKMKTDKTTSPHACERFNPNTASAGTLEIGGAYGRDLANIYYKLCDNFKSNELLRPIDTYNQETYNPVLNILNMLFGTKYLFSFRDNAGVHPLGQMAALGKSLLDKTINNMFVASGGAAVGGILSGLGSLLGGLNEKTRAIGALSGGLGEVSKAFSGLFMACAFVGLSAGILLYYVLPMLPFMHFFFAVGRWVKTIFEALVGMPLWGLAHLKMEGAGLPSKASAAGYFMLLEIFLRPIITVFALLASLSTFSAIAYALNIVFGMITNNLIGYDPVMQSSAADIYNIAYFRPKLDQFFFMVMYVVLTYIIASNSFRMIDLIPDGIMKWLSETRTFGASDNADDYVDQTSSWVAMPTVMYGNKVGGALNEVLYNVPAGIGGSVGHFLESVMPKPSSSEAGGAEPPTTDMSTQPQATPSPQPSSATGSPTAPPPPAAGSNGQPQAPAPQSPQAPAAGPKPAAGTGGAAASMAGAGGGANSGGNGGAGSALPSGSLISSEGKGWIQTLFDKFFGSGGSK